MIIKVEYYNYCNIIISILEIVFCKFYCMCILMFWIVLFMWMIDLDLVIYYFVYKNIYYFIFYFMCVEIVFNVWIFVENYFVKECDFYLIIVYLVNYYLRYLDILLIIIW